MCWECFKQYTDAPVVNERVVAAYRMIAKRGDDATYSTLLHVIVGDMNVDDWIFDSDQQTDWGRDRYRNAEPWEREIFDALAALSEEERATAVAMEWGYLNEEGTLREGLR